MRVLVVDDEDGLVSALRVGLEREGYAVDIALSAHDAVEKLASSPYDLVVLDVNLPDGSGFDIARGIRDGTVTSEGGADTRILLLTARGQLSDRVRGLDSGADDYLVKPFALAELAARLRALLRRDTQGGSAQLQVGEVVLDTATHIVRRGTRELTLTRKEFGVLRYLMARPDHLVPAEELLTHVWDENADPFSQTVRVTVGTLRRKLTVGTESPLLQTVVGRGYRLRDTAAAGTPDADRRAGTSG